MNNPDEMMLYHVVVGDDAHAAGAPLGRYVGQFKCPECGTWVGSRRGQSWRATSRETDAYGRPVPAEMAVITDLEPSVEIDGDHARTYPFHSRGKLCCGWHGFFVDGKWTLTR